MAALNCSKESNQVEFSDCLRTNRQRRSIRFRFGEYDGKNSKWMPSCRASDCTSSHLWYRALSKTMVMGTREPAPARLRIKVQTVPAVTYPSSHTRTIWCVTAFSAPNTLVCFIFSSRGDQGYPRKEESRGGLSAR